MTEHVSNFDLDALRLGKLDAERAELVRAHVGACARCARQNAELERAVEEFRAQFDPAVLARETLARVESEPWWSKLAAWISGPTAWKLAGAAAALLIAVIVLSGPDENTVRLKGGDRALEVFVVEPSGPRALGPEGAPLGARLAVRYDAAEASWARFLWESSPGEPEPLYPGAGLPALRVEAGPRWLEREVELDRQTTTETLYAVFCDRPFDDLVAVAAIAGGGGASGCHLESVAIPKRGSP